MKIEDFYSILGDIDEAKIAAAGKAAKQSGRASWVKWCAAAACLVLGASAGILFANGFSPSANDNTLQSGNITDLAFYAAGRDEITDIAESKDDGTPANNSREDVPSDMYGSYAKAVNADDLTQSTAAFFGGSYLDDNGNYVVVLTADTAENRAVVCEELEITEETTVFKTGKYTLAYLTMLQSKITDAMINGELPFVTSSGVYETINKIKVSSATNDEAELSKLKALDTVGGAIEIEYAVGNAFQDLLEEKLS